MAKEVLDFKRFNANINAGRQSTYGAKLRDALGSRRITAVGFKAGKTISFSTPTKGKNAVGMVIEIDKN